jgi:hypothetical protein
MPADQPDVSSDLATRSEEALAASAPRQFVTPLISLEHQVGAHVIHALQQDSTVAVLTTVMSGPGGSQCIVSVGLDAARMEQVQQLLAESTSDEVPRVPCVGFHCFLPPKAGANDA